MVSLPCSTVLGLSVTVSVHTFSTLGPRVIYVLKVCFLLSVCQTDGVEDDGSVVSHLELLKVAPLV